MLFGDEPFSITLFPGTTVRVLKTKATRSQLPGRTIWQGPILSRGDFDVAAELATLPSEFSEADVLELYFGIVFYVAQWDVAASNDAARASATGPARTVGDKLPVIERSFATVSGKFRVFVDGTSATYQISSVRARQPSAQEFEGGILVANVTDAGRGVSNWGLKVFERERGSRYRVHRDAVKEISFPVSRVRKALARRFREVRAFDVRGWSRPKKSSGRLYFVCRR